jgi:tetratricopeptide (TPR) repeat protein
MNGAGLVALIEAARKAQYDLSVDEWCDVHYLATHLGSAPDPPDPPPAVGPPPPARSEPAGPPPPDSAAAEVSDAPRAELSIPPPADPLVAVVLPRQPGLPVRVPAPAPVARTDFAKAMRPLKRTVTSPNAVELDLAATIHRAAQTRLMQPDLVPLAERWLSVGVVIDDAASGPAWTPETRTLLRALSESAAFSDVRVWRFNADDPARRLTVRGGSPAAIAGRNSREIVDPSGRMAVLVLSDCVGAGWGDGRVGSMIESWSGTGPVAIVNLLPQRLWSRSRLPLVEGEWRAVRPAAPGQPRQWRATGDLLDEPSPAGPSATARMVPVIDLTPGSLRRWAALVSGDVPHWSPGVAFDTAGRTPPVEDLADELPDGDDPHRRRVERFRAASAPETFHLATRLSAVPLLPPVVRMVQRTMQRKTGSMSWAELLLSGLVYRVDGTQTIDGPRYDFASGIREQLLTKLSRRESLELLRKVSDFISANLGGTLDFPALLSLAPPRDDLTEVDLPLARVAVDVLRGLGGTYRDKADKLTQLLQNGSQGSGNFDGTNGAAHRSTPSMGGDLVTTSSRTATSLSASREISRELIWDVPQRTQYFTGREELLERLRQELVHNASQAAILVPQAIFGLGGVGKTALANEYAYRFRSEYDIVWWIPAEDPTDVRRSLVELSRALRLPENTDQAETIRSLLRALHDGYPKSRWLLIYDNATDPEPIADLMPGPTRSGHVLVTSREQAWGQRGAILRVTVFSRDESTSLLRSRAQRLTEDEADQLAALLDDLPLALHQAAAWHAETKLPVTDYLQRYHEKLALLEGTELPPEYPRPVGATFGVSYDQLRSRSAAAAQLLQLCSYFGPEPVLVDLIYRARSLPGLPAALNRKLGDRTTIEREIRNIGRYELIRFDPARGRFQLHRLVQSVLRTTLPESQRQTTPEHAHAILALANPGSPDGLDRSGLLRHAQLSPHILPSGIVGSADTDARRVVLDQIRYRYVTGDFEGSRDLAEHTVASWRQHDERDVQLLIAQRHLAATLRALGEPLRSLEIDEHVMDGFRETVGEESDHYLVTANGYGSDLRALGRFKEALEFDRKLLDQHRRVLGDDDPDTLRTANNYAVDLRLMGEFGQARDLDTESVRLWTEGYGSDHSNTLFAVGNLVRDYYGLGWYSRALDMQQEAIAAQEAELGADHLNVLAARRSIATLLRKHGRYETARKRAEENYTAYSKRFPEHHEHTLAAAMSLANALRDENKDLPSLQRAREILEAALRVYERSFAGHPFVEVCMTNLAVVLRRLGDVAQARRLNTDARKRLIAKLGEKHPYALCTTTNLANDHAAMGDYETACELSGSAYELSLPFEIRGEDHPYTLVCALNHALNLQDAGREGEAEPLWQETVVRFDRVLGADHPDSQAARERRRLDADIEPPPT